MLEAAQPLVVVRARQGRGQCGGLAHAAAAAAATTLDQDHFAAAVRPGCPRRRPHHAPRVTTAPRRHAGGGAETFRGGTEVGRRGGPVRRRGVVEAGAGCLGASGQTLRAGGEAGGFCPEKGVLLTPNSSQFSTERP